MESLDGLGYRDTTAVVTGCASGMGEATARVLGELGTRVHGIDIRPPKVALETFHQMDLADPDAVRTTARALRDLGPIDHLFNCAGISHSFGPMACMLVNYIGTRQLTEELLVAMVDGGGIAIISSDAGMAWQQHLATNLELLAIDDPAAARQWCEARPDAIRDGYSVSKEMLNVWALHRSISLGEQRRIRINCIAPCPTKTAFTADAEQSLGADYFARFPYPLLGRIATPEEQAWPLVLLNSPLNAVVTGSVLYTDQGFAGGLLTGSLDASDLMG